MATFDREALAERGWQPAGGKLPDGPKASFSRTAQSYSWPPYRGIRRIGGEDKDVLIRYETLLARESLTDISKDGEDPVWLVEAQPAYSADGVYPTIEVGEYGDLDEALEAADDFIQRSCPGLESGNNEIAPFDQQADWYPKPLPDGLRFEDLETEEEFRHSFQAGIQER